MVDSQTTQRCPVCRCNLTEREPHKSECPMIGTVYDSSPLTAGEIAELMTASQTAGGYGNSDGSGGSGSSWHWHTRSPFTREDAWRNYWSDQAYLSVRVGDERAAFDAGWSAAIAGMKKVIDHA